MTGGGPSSEGGATKNIICDAVAGAAAGCSLSLLNFTFYMKLIC